MYVMESYIETGPACQMMQQFAGSGSSWISLGLCKGAIQQTPQQQCGVGIQAAVPPMHVRSCVFSTGRHAAACIALPCRPAMLKHFMLCME